MLKARHLLVVALLCIASQTIFAVQAPHKVGLAEELDDHQNTGLLERMGSKTRRHKNTPLQPREASLAAHTDEETLPSRFVGLAKAGATTKSSGNTYVSVTESGTEWYIWVLLAVGVLLIVFVCFLCRKMIKPCVAAIENCLYHMVSGILYPFKVLLMIIKFIVYPIKQCIIASYYSCYYFCNPSMRKI